MLSFAVQNSDEGNKMQENYFEEQIIKDKKFRNETKES